MKKLILLLLSISTFTAFSQCDDSFFPFEEGVSFEQTSYDKKGKEQGKTLSTVLAVEGTSATVKNVFYDQKGKSITDGEYTIICEGNVVKFDFNNFLPKDMLSQYGDAEVIVEGDFISIPNNLKAGRSLPDGSGTITVIMGGEAAMNIKMDMTITNRKVEKMETLTTPAGSFETYKITQTSIMKMNMMGISRTTETSSASWFAREVGMVKNESFNEKGKLMGSTLLTTFSKK